ncbi:porin family protein [Lacinutrix iliipiscaria]|uniref:Porin family protein n=1 Tax=Lacinutrix iliipiscaria TaxID=1230532 RepID=A0ABW5WLU7_9FLAO
MKNLLLTIVVLTSTFYGFSQENGAYGVRAGINISNLDFDPDATFGNTHRNGLAFGFFAEYELGDKLLIMPELQYSSEGAKEKDLRVDYIQAPIFFKYTISDRLHAGAGPLVGVKIHEENDGFKNFSLSAQAGLEFAITDEIFIDARYTYGLTNILDEETGYKAKNTNVQFGIGYKM